jgi:hypothetical protein
MITDINSEDRLVKQTFADHLHLEQIREECPQLLETPGLSRRETDPSTLQRD